MVGPKLPRLGPRPPPLGRPAPAPHLLQRRETPGHLLPPALALEASLTSPPGAAAPPAAPASRLPRPRRDLASKLPARLPLGFRSGQPPPFLLPPSRTSTRPAHRLASPPGRLLPPSGRPSPSRTPLPQTCRPQLLRSSISTSCWVSSRARALHHGSAQVRAAAPSQHKQLFPETVVCRGFSSQQTSQSGPTSQGHCPPSSI